MAVIVSGEHIGSYAIADIWFKGAQPNWANPQTLDNFLFENHIEELTKAIKDSIGFPVQAIFLRSKGRSFCAGGNALFLKECLLTDRIEDRNIKGAMSYIRKADELCQLIAQSPIPIISFLQGEAIGLGAEIACASSHIVVTAEATLSIPQLFMGLIMLSIPRLVEKVGPGLAFLIQTSTPPKTPLTAPQMLAMGLAEAQVDHVEAGYQLIPKLLNAKILNKRLAEKTEGCRNISIILDSSHVRENLIRGTLPQQAPEWLRKLKARVDSIHNRDALNLVEKILNGAKPDLLETEMPQLLGHPDVFNFLRK